MKPGKLVLAVLVAALFMWLTDWLWYGILMIDYFTQPPGAKEMPDMMWLTLGILVFAFAFVSIYAKGVSGGTPVGEGSRYGLWVTLLVFVPMGFIFYSMYTHAPLTEYLVDIVYRAIQLAIMGILVAYVSGLPGHRGDGKGSTSGDDAKQTGGG